MKAARALLAALALGCGLLSPAQAEVWGYIDAKGVAHFAAEKVDERYELFFRGGESFDTQKFAAPPRAVAVPTAPPKLIAFFEVSPSYKQVKHHMREASNAHGVDYELLQALIATESGFDASAISPKGAVGLMQVLPSTAERWGVAADKKLTVGQKLTDPRTNIRAGTRYLQYLQGLFPGKLELALAAYNAGEGAVQRAGNRIPNYPETQNYVKTVMQLYGMLKPPAAAMAARAGVNRVRVEIPGMAAGSLPQAAPGGASQQTAPPGGAVGRGNMPPGSPPACC